MDKNTNKHGLTVLQGKSREERIAETKKALMGTQDGDDIYDFLLENIHNGLDPHVEDGTLTQDVLSDFVSVYIGFIKGIMATDVVDLDPDKAINILDKVVDEEYWNYVMENKARALKAKYEENEKDEFFVTIRGIIKRTIEESMPFQLKCLVLAIGDNFKKRWVDGGEYDDDAELTYKAFRKAVHWKGNLPLDRATGFCDTLTQWRCAMQDPETGEIYCTSILNSYHIDYDPRNSSYKFFFTFSDDVRDVFLSEAIGEMFAEEEKPATADTPKTKVKKKIENEKDSERK